MVHNHKRTVFKLDHPARLIVINAHSSYLELKNNSQESKCLWCANAKPHEHDIIGKVKFDPINKSYLLSMVEKVKIKTKKGLEITVAKTTSSQDDENERITVNETNSKVTHWTTQEVANEAEGAKYFAQHLINQNGHVKCASIKQGDKRYVLSSTSKSVLKPRTSTVKGGGKNCDKCSSNHFETLTEMQLHFMNVHEYKLHLKDITLVNNDESIDDKVLSEEEPLFLCDHCHLECESDEKKIEHMNQVHDHRQCAKCLQQFKTNLTFRKHSCSLQDSKVDRKHPCHL